MSDFVIQYRNWLFAIFMFVSIAFLVGIQSTYNGGFYVSTKLLFIPLLFLIVVFVKKNMSKIKALTPWSSLRIWLFSVFLVYPLLVLMSWPYFMAVNALLGGKDIVALGGEVIKKDTTTGTKGTSFHIRTVDENTASYLALKGDRE